ncbi:Gfo/Idh/MocA family oxidoreductase [Erysipelothrix sp. HDW6C]|uniref:Gfo/Idh/MocA family protein n=1 Tax=Erysipelothrix sp. HDW6C TaxID=2714930 RepID=UPI00140BC7B6|nr:Gfo/Idh/MocA family oxidoreductase [Erysipelothrix sp. HDW6C]QIK69580.1 Gfo/Idh/MocA family oxidoreductase [Erysipelothrix sp. HDW6C]
MQKIGVMGLGGIAIKAYLPVMLQMQEQVEWHMFTRNEDKLATLKAKYGLNHTFHNFDTFIESGITAVFIHTPTDTHAQLIRKFLNKGIHVYVDKPVSEDINEVIELHDLAAQKGLILMTGFNRRVSPINTRLKAVPNKSVITVQKTRENALQDTTFALYDMMIHVVDLALFLLDAPVINTHYRVVEIEGALQHASIQFETEYSTATAMINMKSGGRSETVEVMSASGFYRSEEMDRLIINNSEGCSVERFGDWTPTLDKRGFTQIITTFVQAAKRKEASLNFTSESSIKSHQYIANLIKHI